MCLQWIERYIGEREREREWTKRKKLEVKREREREKEREGERERKRDIYIQLFALTITDNLCPETKQDCQMLHLAYFNRPSIHSVLKGAKTKKSKQIILLSHKTPNNRLFFDT
jgi:hypothetical protein